MKDTIVTNQWYPNGKKEYEVFEYLTYVHRKEWDSTGILILDLFYSTNGNYSDYKSQRYYNNGHLLSETTQDIDQKSKVHYSLMKYYNPNGILRDIQKDFYPKQSLNNKKIISSVKTEFYENGTTKLESIKSYKLYYYIKSKQKKRWPVIGRKTNYETKITYDENGERKKIKTKKKSFIRRSPLD